MGKATATEGRLIKAGEQTRDKGVTAKGYRVSLWGDENVRKLTVVMIAQHCESTKKHWIVHFNCIVCESDLKAVLKILSVVSQ